MLKALGTDRYSVEEIQAWMDEHNLEIKQKRVHRTHQMNRYPLCEMNVRGRVIHEEKPRSYINIDRGNNGYEIITDVENGYFWTVWTTHCVPVTSNGEESGSRE